MDLGHVGEHADPGVRERHGKRTDASGHARRKHGPDPRTADSPDKLACADVGPDQSKDASAEAERQGIEQVFEAYGGIGAPTRRISTKSLRLSRTPLSVNRTAVRPETRYQANTTLATANDVSVATPAPAMPSGGSGPTPNISVGTSRMCRTWDTR